MNIGVKQGNIHNPYCILERSSKPFKMYTIKITDIKKVKYIGTINFQYFVSGYFHGESLTIDIIARKKSMKAITP